NLAVIGRYVLPPDAFDVLAHVTPGAVGEIQLTDGLAVLAQQKRLLGVRFQGTRHDAGDRLGYLKANVAYALKRPELREPLLSLRFPLSCRFEGGAQARGTVAQPLPASSAGNPEQELIELACPLIAYRGLKTVDAETALGAAAAVAGADLGAAAAYDRLGDRVAFVVGAPPRQADRPQLWLYKDT